MTKQISWAHSDTPVSGVASLALNRPVLNFKEDFRVKSEKAGEVVLVNLTTPLDRPEQIRIAVSDIKDIYTSTDIDPSVFPPSKRGVSILFQLTTTLSVNDPENPGFRVDIPASAHLVLKIPANEYVDAEIAQAMAARLISVLYETGSDGTTRMDSILRGSLVPRDI